MIMGHKKKVLVTGASGFIGSHLVERLVSEGESVRAFVHYNGRNCWGNLERIDDEIMKTVEVIRGDLRDSLIVRRAVENCDVVFHLGALIAIPYSYHGPDSFVMTNVVGTLNVMEACRAEGVPKVIHTSTSECYGTAQYTPMDESHPLEAQSPYAASKIGADMVAGSFHRSYGLPVTILRPFNAYGPRQSGRAIIPTIITQVLKKEAVRLGNVKPIRDFTFVTDTIDAFRKAANSSGSEGQVINIGYGEGIRVEALARKIFSIVGCRERIIRGKERERPEDSEVMELVCDRSKASKVIGWVPSTSLDEGLSKTIQWIRENPRTYKTGLYEM